MADAALKRKGKGDDVTEDDMDPVVHAHNSTPPCSNACNGLTYALQEEPLILCSGCSRVDMCACDGVV